MNTIVRTPEGYISELHTVVKTIKYLVNNHPGLYRISYIQNTINSQLPPIEHFTRKAIIHQLVRIIEIQQK